MFNNWNSKKILSSFLSVALLFSCAPTTSANSSQGNKSNFLENVKSVVSSPKFIVPTAIVGALSATAMATHIYNTKLTKPRNPIDNNIAGVTDERVNEARFTQQDIFSYSPDGKVLNLKWRYHCNNGLSERVTYDLDPPPEQRSTFNELNSKADEILDKMNKDGCKTDFEKVVFLHDYICDHCKYPIGTMIDILTGGRTDLEPPNSHQAYGCLIDGIACCSGMAAAYLFLCTKAGIECRYISGRAGDWLSGGHAWNIVKINGQWYHVDVTFDSSDPLPHSRYKWFMLSEEEISKDHDGFIMNKD